MLTETSLMYFIHSVIIANMIRAVRKKTCYGGKGVLFLQEDNHSEDQYHCSISFYIHNNLLVFKYFHSNCFSAFAVRGHSGRVVTLSPPTSEAGVRSPHGLK